MNQLEQLSLWLVNYNSRHSLLGDSYFRFYDDKAIALWTSDDELLAYFEDGNIEEIKDFLLNK